MIQDLYIDIRAEGDGLTVFTADPNSSSTHGLAPTLKEAWALATRASESTGLRIGRVGPEPGDAAFMVTISEAAERSYIHWAPTLDDVRKSVQQEYGDLTGLTRISIVPVSGGGGMSVTIGNDVDEDTWKEDVERLRKLVEDHTLPEALRRLREGVPHRVDLFQLLQYGVGMTNYDASEILYWEPDGTLPDDRFSDEAIERRLGALAREALAKP